MARIYEDLTTIIKRSKITLYVLAGLIILVLFFYWKIQVLDYQKYWRMAEANRLRELPLTAPRGLILDRQKVILADNIPSFKVSLVREAVIDYEKTIDSLALLLHLNREELKKRIDRYRFLPAYEPIIIMDNLKLEDVSLIEARKDEFPEIKLEVEPRRYYPFGLTGAHLLGYLQEVSVDEIRTQPEKRWRGGEMVGKAGLEKQYNDILTGREGKILEMVDSLGRPRAEISRTEPQPGRNLELSIDFDLQRKAEELLQGREGAIVVMDPRNGECLVWASSPSYDPNRFISRFSADEWLALVNDPGKPLENRVIRGLYSPGSTFKIVMALAALNEGIINESSTFYCSGAIELYNKEFNCWFRPGHGNLNLPEAIRNSCNIYFYQLGRRLSIDTIADYARLMGLGQKTGVDLPGEKEGLVPSTDWKRRFLRQAWYPGETISVAIGQGPLLVTPLQLACLTSVVATRGFKVQPHLFRGMESDGNRERINLPEAIMEKVIEGMWRSVNNQGTGQGAYQPGFEVCGKTGTTQLISRETAERLVQRGMEVKKTHSWFTGFAPRQNPEIVVTVLVEFGGMGGQTAAPIAGQIFKAYREKYVRQTNLQGD
ncbi:MAG: Cell division protein FtsI [Candidatus Saccharicenans subterraneus]|uniref:Beta-lactamase n=1 Tax=Candidatus Saccharicenans subterraneus TaxID=2508984 RepID=A0A3E2BMZ1_9BACT|nr:MAG: Cell division protein FtsI [Candidatus Saccharicenans subterraneum]